MPEYQWKPDASRSKKKKRFFYVRKPMQNALRVLCAAVFLVCLFLLGRYAVDYFRVRQASEELREVYYAETALPATVSPVESSLSAAETSAPKQTALQAVPATAAPAPMRTPYVPVSDYPGNPYMAERSAFDGLQKINPDIVAWLKIDGLLDEAVVLRDNSYYLKRDYRGYHNENGALFLDECCTLETRPKIYVVYGHNMKTGAMFGSLQKYEKTAFYRSTPCVSFNTLYEEGDFAVFSVADLSVSVLSKAIALCHSQSTDSLKSLIAELQFRSVHPAVLDVTAEDQLLLLCTCNGDDNQRKVVAARRLREGETRESIQRRITTGQ